MSNASGAAHAVRIGTRGLSLRIRLRSLAPSTTALAALAGLLVLLAALASVLATHDPDTVDMAAASQDPSAAHWLGTDALGRDLYSRLLYGARISLLGPALVIAGATVGGVAVALACAWHGGWLDRVISRVNDVLFAFPGLLLAVLAVAVLGPGLTAPVVALAVAYLPYMARIVRGVAVRERRMPYIAALEASGMSAWRINLRHLLPNLTPFIVAQATAAFGSALIDLAGVSFLGLGVQPPISDWGLMVSEGQSSLLAGAPGQSLMAGGLIVVTVVVFNLLGDTLIARTDQEDAR
ncbi:ABC transporter permease [Streptomyces sp. NPDC050546]|uniref:ABC transporter permease n=1 Tax=Streptomyces sp. NPDC050546 TaxID=3365628 RepID=UPI0037907C52